MFCFQVIVFCIDFFYPPKIHFGFGSSTGTSPSARRKSKDSGDEEVCTLLCRLYTLAECLRDKAGANVYMVYLDHLAYIRYVSRALVVTGGFLNTKGVTDAKEVPRIYFAYHPMAAISPSRLQECVHIQLESSRLGKIFGGGLG